MTCNSHPTYYPDQAWQGRVVIGENVRLARDTYRIRFECPEIARRFVPGQFVMLKMLGANDPLLGRPLAIYDVLRSPSGEPVALDIVYIAIGRMTRRLATMKTGEELTVWGPLGNGFPPVSVEHLIMVAGGIGQTPFLTLAQEFLGLSSFGHPPRTAPKVRRLSLCYGARSAEFLAGVDDFRRLGVEVQVSTDDGTTGHRGLVTDLLRSTLAASTLDRRIVCCGPEAMMKAVAEIARQSGVACQLSLESPMACGIGICFSCVTRIRDHHGQWDYRRTCVEGPVFDAQDVDFS